MQDNDYDPADFPPFAVTVDLVVLTVRPPQMEVLLVQRNDAPHKNRWALPGGFVGPSQTLLEAAQAKLGEKTGVAVDEAHLEQLGTFGDPSRDPRMRVVSVTYLAMVENPETLTTNSAQWHPTAAVALDQLAFDHAQILSQGIERARAKLEYTTLATTFCGATFTMVELRGVYEAVWGTKLDPANFHRKVLASDNFIEPTNQTTSEGRGRPAKLYRAGGMALLYPPISRQTQQQR